jgi:hypothetical protein
VFLAWHAFVAVAELHARLALVFEGDPTCGSEFRGRAIETILQCQACSRTVGSYGVSLDPDGQALFAELDGSVRRLTEMLSIHDQAAADG